MRKLINSIVFAASILLASTAQAEILIPMYKELKANSPGFIETYVGAVGRGTRWANIALKHDNRKPLYCPPDIPALNAKNFVDILEHELARNDKIAEDFPIEMLLLLGLQRTFPCEKN